ncbi:MAG: hypothetical protein ACQESG_04165 [Nanobdellota archaeon]
MRLLGILAILIIIVFTTILAGDYVYEEQASEETYAQEPVQEWQYAEQEVLETKQHYSFQRIREVRIQSTQMAPTEIFAESGDSLVLVIETSAPCTFRLEGFDIAKPLKPGLYELEFMTPEVGTFRYTCTRAANPNTREGYLYVR